MPLLSRRLQVAPITLAALLALGCSGKQPSPTAPCERECQVGVAARGLRETLKLVYNLTLQGQPVGAQDATLDCPLGGSAHVEGSAASDPDQGTTTLELSYTLGACRYIQKQSEPAKTYTLEVSGVVKETGVLAVDPSTTTAVLFESAAVTLEGSVYDPPLDFRADGCALALAQSGSILSGTLCDSEVGIDL